MDTVKPILILGVGNVFRRDDACGVVAARALADSYRGGPAGALVEVREASGEGAALLTAWEGRSAVIVIDATHSAEWVHGCETPVAAGTILRIDAHKQRLPSGLFNCSSHAFGVAAAVEMARVLGRLPPVLLLYGVMGGDFAAGETLSAEVRAALPALVQQVERDVSHVML